MVQLSHPYMTTGKTTQFSRSVISDSLWPHGLHHARPPCPSPTPGKTIALTMWTFVSKVMSLPLNVLSRFVIAFLPGSKHLLKCNIVKIFILPPKNLQTQCSPYQNPNRIFHKNRKNHPEIHMQPQETWIVKTILEKKKKVGGLRHSDFKTYYKALVIKRLWTNIKIHIKTNGGEQKAHKKILHIWLNNIWQRYKDYTRRKDNKQLRKKWILTCKRDEVRWFTLYHIKINLK